MHGLTRRDNLTAVAEPTHAPIRVLVQGASTVIWVARRRGEPVRGHAFPRILESALGAAGQPSTVETSVARAQPPTYSLRHWDKEVLAWAPDVVITHYGQADMLHLFVPWWLVRHAQRHRGVPGPLQDLYRRRVLPIAWRALMRFQRFLDGLIGARLFIFRPRRVARQVEELIRRSLDRTETLYLVLDVPVPSPHYQKWFPGMAQRARIMDKALAGVVTKIAHPDVRMFPVAELVRLHEEALGRPGAATPDGAHYSAAMHELIADALCAEILEWQAARESRARNDTDGTPTQRTAVVRRGSSRNAAS